MVSGKANPLIQGSVIYW